MSLIRMDTAGLGSEKNKESDLVSSLEFAVWLLIDHCLKQSRIH